MKLRIQNLNKSFGSKEVLRALSFCFESGRIYALLGRNGAGKTTLFNCLFRNLEFSSGSFSLRTDDGTEKPLDEQQIAFVESMPEVPNFLTGREYIEFLLDVQKLDPDRFLSGLGLGGRGMEGLFDLISLSLEDQYKLAKDYSHGMKSKLLLLANLLLQQPVMLLDEPLSSVDVVAAEEIKDILKRDKTQRITIISTHLMDLALSLCDEVVLLREGQLIAVPRGDLDTQAYQDCLLAALKGEDDAYRE